MWYISMDEKKTKKTRAIFLGSISIPLWPLLKFEDNKYP